MFSYIFILNVALLFIMIDGARIPLANLCGWTFECSHKAYINPDCHTARAAAVLRALLCIATGNIPF